VIGIQDMGAAGLTCSTCETAARGGCGSEIDVLRVPRRAEGMSPYEVMLSESQERMLLIVRRGREGRIKRLFAKWGLNAVEIGRVTRDGRLRVKEGETVVADIPARALTEDAPIYQRPVRKPRSLTKAQHLSLRSIPQPKDLNEVLLRLLGSPTIASKAPVYERYDYMVQTNTVVLPGRADAAVLRLKGLPAAPTRGKRGGTAQAGTNRLLAATIDGNGRYTRLDPYAGGALAVAEAARNLVCVGAQPLAITDCLNFGSPEDPEVMWQFKECVRGIGDACRAFATPVTGGNVSFYNESRRGAIDPTPVIGMIGLIQAPGSMPQAARRRSGLQPAARSPQLPITANFKDGRDVIILLGETREELGGSEYLAVIHRRKRGRPPRVDLSAERVLQRLMVDAASRGLLKSAHDCSDGGLAVTVAESCVMDKTRSVGATVSPESIVHSPQKIRVDALLFGESAGRIIVSCEAHRVTALEALAREHGVPAAVIGRVGGARLSVGPWIDQSIDVVSETWHSGLIRQLQEPR
jgi:phosphoribosylformylglycinamidine synthase